MSERPLPRTTKDTVYRVATATRHSRRGAPLTHAVKVDRVRIGTRHNGEPLMSEFPQPKALCGTLAKRFGEDFTGVTEPACARCRRELRKLGVEVTG